MQKTIVILGMVCALFCLSSLQAHGGAVDAKSFRNSGGWLRFGVHAADAGTFDPHLAQGSQDRAVADMLFNGLLRYVPGQAPRMEPDLAADFPDFYIQDKKQIWTVELKQDVYFHAGEDGDPVPLTADDVVFSLRKAADPERSHYAGEYAGMRFEKLDAATIQIILDEPLSPILFFPKISNYSGGFIVSKQAVQERGKAHFGQHPVGSGPFCFERYVPGEKVVLAANEHYFRGSPEVRGVIVRYMPRLADREAAFQQGDLDVFVGSGDPEWVEQAGRAPGQVFDVYGVGEVMALHLNTRQKPLDDLLVRRALLLALDRKSFSSVTSRILVEPVYAPVPEKSVPGGLSGEKVCALGLGYQYNLRLARQFLAEAGFAQGLSLSMIVSEKRIYRVCAQIIKEQLQEINVQCTVEIVPHQVMHARIRNDEADLILYGAWRPTADAFLSQFFHSDASALSGVASNTNFSHYRNIDGLLEAARQEISPLKQTQLWAHAQIRILGEAAAYPLFAVKQNCLRRPDLDYGHPLTASIALYPQFTENTRFTP